MPIGVNGLGPHKHNDWLSFELCMDGKPVIIDPGTYCYTGNIELRRLFRSTAYHNTVVINSEEQICIHNSEFGLVNPFGDVNVLRWETDARRDILEAEHTGYTRLARPVIHRRRFLLDKQSHRIEIEDSFHGHGKYLLEWHLHLEEGLRCSFQEEGIDILDDGEAMAYLSFSGKFGKSQIKKGWISKSYNQKKKAEVIYYTFQHNNEESSPVFVHQLNPYV